MNTIEQKENYEAWILRKNANRAAVRYTKNKNDYAAATLALLWCAFEEEAMKQGLTHWRGAVLGDDAAKQL